jgi:hypothetical protein
LLKISRRSPVARLVTLAAALLCGCSTVGLNLPFEGAPVLPDGLRLKPSIGWLTTHPVSDPAAVPDGSVSLRSTRVGSRQAWEQVRRLVTATGEYSDSILLDKETLRPIQTWRWTPRGTYIVRYNHRSVEREFQPIAGLSSRWSEILEVEPYSALGAELIVATLPMGEGQTGMVPVTVDTLEKGWAWMKYTVMREIDMIERPNAKPITAWVVDLDMAGDRSRVWIAADGKSIRRIEKLGPDNEVLSTVRRMLLGGP